MNSKFETISHKKKRKKKEKDNQINYRCESNI